MSSPSQHAQVPPIWAPYGQHRGAHMGNPDGLDVHLATGSMSAPNGQPTNEPTWAYCGPHLGSPLWVANMGPIWAAQMGATWAAQMARCPFGCGLHVRPKWAAHV